VSRLLRSRQRMVWVGDHLSLSCPTQPNYGKIIPYIEEADKSLGLPEFITLEQ
jgi:hypothetical protein